MKKIFAFFAALITIAAAFSGCAKKPANEPDGDSAPVDMGQIYYNNSMTSDTFLVGPDGKKINASEIKFVTNKGEKETEPTNVLEEGKFYEAECGFAYAYVPSVYFDSTNNPEKFAGDQFVDKIIDKESSISTEFIRVNAGDKFGGLTVKSARSVFNSWNADQNYYTGSEIEFDGEITVTGLFTIPPQSEQYPGMVQDMDLHCDGGSEFPLSVEFGSSPEIGFYHSPYQPNTSIYTDFPSIKLGKITDYDLDLDGFGEGSILERAEVTLTDVKLIYGIQGNHVGAYAKLVNVKRL